MLVRWIVVLATATVGLSPIEAAPEKSLSFDCDAVPGSVSEMGSQHLAPTTAISGSLRAVQTRHDNNLSPTATVKLSSRKDFVALQMTPVEPNSSTFVLVIRNGDSKEEARTVLTEVPLNEPVPFRIALQGKEVHVEAGGQAIAIPQSFRGKPTVGVTCSTGHFRFDGITLG